MSASNPSAASAPARSAAPHAGATTGLIEGPLPAQRTLVSIAVVGTLCWGGWMVAGPLLPAGHDPVSRALGLAILALVPLGLATVRAEAGEQPFFSLLVVLLPPAQLAGIVSLAAPSGPLAAGCASVWVIACIVIAVMGLGRLRSASPGSRPHDWPYHWGVGASWLLLPMGAVWLVMARAGASPLHLSSLVVSLTAVHFHFAAFATPLVFACVWKRTVSPVARRLMSVAIAVTVMAVILLFLAIMLGPTAVDGASGELAATETSVGGTLSRLGASLFTVAYAIHSVVSIGQAGKRLTPLPRLLTGLGALAPLWALPLAVLSTFGLMDLDTMVRWHGQLNAYGFAGLSLLGWALDFHGGARLEEAHLAEGQKT